MVNVWTQDEIKNINDLFLKYSINKIVVIIKKPEIIIKKKLIE